jgi:hypothetical protein
MKRFSVFLIVGLFLFVFSGAASGMLINGDFETLDHVLGKQNGIYLDELADGQWDIYDNIPGWSTYDGFGIEIQRETIVGAHSPEHYVELDSGGTSSNSGMVQYVWMEEGLYDLSFWYRPRTNELTDNGIDVLFMDGDNVVLSVDGISSEQDEWLQYSVQLYAPYEYFWGIGFHATGLANTLGGFIDDVELTAVPEPATMLLLFIGLAGLAGIRRKKFKK